MPQDAVPIQHGIDMPLTGNGFQRVIGGNVTGDRRCIKGKRMPVLPDDLFPVFGHGGGDNMRKETGCIGKISIRTGGC